MKNIVYLDTNTNKIKTTTYAKFDEAHFSYPNKPPGAQILMKLGMKEQPTSPRQICNKFLLKIICKHPDAIIPSKGTADSAGFDLYSIESITIEPQYIDIVDT